MKNITFIMEKLYYDTRDFAKVENSIKSIDYQRQKSTITFRKRSNNITVRIAKEIILEIPQQNRAEIKPI